MSAQREVREKPAGVPITNADRVIPDSGRATKLDAARYYERVADWWFKASRERVGGSG